MARNPTIRTADVRVGFWVVIGIICYWLLLCDPEPNPKNGGYPVGFSFMPSKSIVEPQSCFSDNFDNFTGRTQTYRKYNYLQVREKYIRLVLGNIVFSLRKQWMNWIFLILELKHISVGNIIKTLKCKNSLNSLKSNSFSRIFSTNSFISYLM